jgi:hypothetical protein
MQKKMKRYLLITAALLAIGCNNDDSREFVNNEIKVVANLGTRATMTSFEQGDKMGLYAVEYVGDQAQPLQVSGNYLNNEPMVYNGTKWDSGRTLYWSASACDFYGIYPYQPIAAVDEILFEVETDQNAAETADALGGYEASDLMWAKAEKVAQTDGVVNLQFHHMMSRLVVKVETGPKLEGEIPDDIVTHIYNTATTAKVNYQIGSLEKYSLSENKTITMRKIDNRTFDAIIVPQFIERSTPLVEITMGGIAYLLNYSMSFRPGYQHTITVTLNTSPDQEKIEISIDGEVDDWK